MRHSGEVYDTGRDAVLGTCRRILGVGREVSPRGRRTKELLHETFMIIDPTDPIPDGINRAKLSDSMAALEALQNVAGVSRPELFRQIAPQSAKFSMLVYGERLAGQLPAVIANLEKDPDSRQAVALIWHHDDLGGGDESNLCTIGLQFILRSGALHLATTMRSNDAWWGLCYDVPQFCLLQCSVANALGVAVGPYVHHAGSMHLYDRHWKAASELTDPPDGWEGLSLSGVGRPLDPWETIRVRAWCLLDGTPLEDPTASEEWFAAALAPHLEAAAA